MATESKRFCTIKKINDAIASSKLTAYLLPLIALTAYVVHLVITDRFRSPSGYYIIHYLYTYDHGFIARGLVGEILSWFFDTMTPFRIKVVLIVFAQLLVIVSSLCIGYAINKTKDDPERHKMVLFMILLLVILPVTFRCLLIDSKLDKILWIITLAAVLLAEKKYGIWLCIPLCVLAVFVNPVFLFCSMILIAIILLQKLYDNHYSVKNALICGLSYVLMIASGLWGIISEKFVGFSSGAELVKYYFSRYSEPLTQEEADWFARECVFDYFESLTDSVKLAYQIYGKEWGNIQRTVLNFFFLALPIFILLAIFWHITIKAESNKFQKFIFFLCAISPVVTVLPIIFSWEASKYFGHNVIVQLCLIVYYIVHNNKAVIDASRKVIAYCRVHWLRASVIGTYLSLFVIFLNYAKSLA